MRILNDIERTKEKIGPVVATIGNFDGLHIGHRKIIEQVRMRGEKLGLMTVVMTFDPHPARVISPTGAPHLIHTRHQKIKMLEKMGVDILIFMPFDRDLSLLAAEEFFTNRVLRRMEIEEIYIGENFRFGRNRSADSDALFRIGSKLGFKVDLIESVKLEGEVVSSSLIRRLIADGNVERAALFLGQPFSIEGEVVSGEGIGKKMRIPTANVRPENELIPGMGVYITESLVCNERFRSVTNIGVRPTFALYTSTIETHLIDFASSIYGEDIEVVFHRRIRDEMKFDDVEKLKKQIECDVREAKDFFGKR